MSLVKKVNVGPTPMIPSDVVVGDERSFMLEVTSLFSSISIADLTLPLLDINVDSFGKLNSHVYRSVFLSMTKKAGLTAQARFWVIALFVIVKNKSRVLSSIKTFEDEAWYSSVKKFIETHIVQYTREANNVDTFAAVHLTGIMPSVTFVIWVLLKPYKDAYPDWAYQCFPLSQMDIPQVMKEKVKEKERDFWENQVKKGSAAYEAGFNESYFDTKSMDKYPFFNLDGTVVNVTGEADLLKYINDIIEAVKASLYDKIKAMDFKGLISSREKIFSRMEALHVTRIDVIQSWLNKLSAKAAELKGKEKDEAVAEAVRLTKEYQEKYPELLRSGKSSSSMSPPPKK